MAPTSASPSISPTEKGAPVTGESNVSKLIVGPDIKLKGAEITDCDTLVVEGRVEASMDSRVIQIAEHGVFVGKVDIDVAEIRGRFEGELVARKQLRVTPREFDGERLEIPRRYATPLGDVSVEVYVRVDEAGEAAAEELRKQHEGRGDAGEPTTVDAIMAGDIQLIVNTPYGVGPRVDGYEIRTAAVIRGVPCITTVQGLAAAVQGIDSLIQSRPGVRSLQEHAATLNALRTEQAIEGEVR